MLQYTRENLELRKCYQVNEELLNYLKNIASCHGQIISFHIDVISGDTNTHFETLDDFKEHINSIYQIDTMEINIHFKQTPSDLSSLCIFFNNGVDPDHPYPTEIVFLASSPRGYYVLKNEVLTLLKKYKLSYSWLSQIPIISIMSFLILCFLVFYIENKNIIFATHIQGSIFCGLFTVSFISFISPSKRIKRLLFPYTEFQFGLNKKSLTKANNIRNLLCSGILLAIFIGIITDWILGIFK